MINLQLMYAIFNFIATCILLFLAILGWRRRQRIGTAFMAVMLAVATISFFYGFELLLSDFDVVMTVIKLEYIGFVSLPITWLFFGIEYSGNKAWLTHRNRLLIAVLGILFLLSVWTNEYHHLFYEVPRLVIHYGLLSFEPDYGPLFWLYIVFLYGTAIFISILLWRVTRRHHGLFRRQALLLFVASSIPWMASVVEIFEVPILSRIDVVSFSFILGGLLMAYAVLYMSVLDISPIASRQIIDNLRDGVLVIDLEQRIRAFNQSFNLAFMDTNHLIGKDIRVLFPILPAELFHPDTELSQYPNFVYQDHFYDIQLSSLKDEEGHHSGKLLLFRDVTAARLLEQERKAFELRYQTLYENTSDAIFIFSSDQHLFTMNPSASRLSGYDTENFGTLTIEQLHFPPIEEEQLHIETQLYAASGDLIDVELIGTIYHETTMDLFIYSVRDISQRKEAQRLLDVQIHQLSILRQVNDEIANTLNLDSVMMLALDALVRLSGSNAGFIAILNEDKMEVRQIIGRYPSDLMGHILNPDENITGRVMTKREPELILDVFQDEDYLASFPDTKALIVAPLLSINNLVGLIRLETKFPERYSEEVYQLVLILVGRIAVAIENANLYRTVSDRLDEVRRLYEQLTHLEQLKTDMIRIAAHDLKNPLTGVMGFIQILQDEINENPDYFVSISDFIPLMSNAANRMMQIITDILSLERIEDMAQEKPSDVVNLSQMVSEILEEHHHSAELKEQLLEQHLTKADLLVIGDKPQLQEAITNLISNAIKYTPKGGFIRICLEQEDHHILFEVQDKGYGIPSELQVRLFQPFYRAKMSETRHIDGTGLGLYLVKKIIERHGGTMHFESEYGEGSTFGFNLPLIDET